MPMAAFEKVQPHSLLELSVFLTFAGLQKRLTALPPTLRSMKTDYASLRSQVRNFSEFYGAAINDAKKQVRSPHRNQPPSASLSPGKNGLIVCLSWDRSLQPSVRCLRRTKTCWRSTGRRWRCAGSTTSSWWSSKVWRREPALGAGSPFSLDSFFSLARRQHPRAVPREARAKGGPARGGPLRGSDHGPQQRILPERVEQRKEPYLRDGQSVPAPGRPGGGAAFSSRLSGSSRQSRQERLTSIPPLPLSGLPGD